MTPVTDASSSFAIEFPTGIRPFNKTHFPEKDSGNVKHYWQTLLGEASTRLIYDSQKSQNHDLQEGTDQKEKSQQPQ